MVFFGLLHGLGFAGALTEIGLPQADIWLALLAFNLGIEIGQIGFVIVILIIWKLLRLMRLSSVTAFPRQAAYVIPQDRALVAQELLLFENGGSDDVEELVTSVFTRVGPRHNLLSPTPNACAQVALWTAVGAGTAAAAWWWTCGVLRLGQWRRWRQRRLSDELERQRRRDDDRQQ